MKKITLMLAVAVSLSAISCKTDNKEVKDKNATEQPVS